MSGEDSREPASPTGGSDGAPPESVDELLAWLDETGTDTASLYGTLAPVYEFAMEHAGLPEVQRATVTEALPDGTASVVEYACGMGGLLRRLAEHYEAVVGVDRSARQLALARGKTDASLLRADVRHPVLDASFDAAVLLGGSLGHLTARDDARRCFESVATALAPGGLFVFDAHAPSAHAEPSTEEHAADGDRFRATHRGELSAADEDGLVERTDEFTFEDREAGRTVSVETPEYAFRCRSRDAVAELLESAGFEVVTARRRERMHLIVARRA